MVNAASLLSMWHGHQLPHGITCALKTKRKSSSSSVARYCTTRTCLRTTCSKSWRIRARCVTAATSFFSSMLPLAFDLPIVAWQLLATPPALTNPTPPFPTLLDLFVSSILHFADGNVPVLIPIVGDTHRVVAPLVPAQRPV
ncbi:hypothetical protein PsorP6_010798 [Peronosclerospora sorghi]|uniref:Uncharacterized protein n=1 Tax=Peronosclerospora sorghi TaxID=230839 RepID=A0ACC0VU33_9STRA|nr:hypothetical protein PsorP6_010798 [Peronosclerospora sorghi]